MIYETVIDKCACKGVRKCAICEPVLVENEKSQEITLMNGECLSRRKIYIFCFKCNQATPLESNLLSEIENFIQQPGSECERLFECNCAKFKQSDLIPIKGIFLSNNFLSLTEETFFIDEINKSEWVTSQSGRFKQDYGPQVNFKQKKIKSAKFTGLPFYTQFLLERLNQLNKNVIEDFHPVELCNLKYDSSRASCIDPHFDDFWLWGDRLITISLGSNTFYTLSPGNDGSLHTYADCEILVPLKKLSLIILSDDARNKWMHSIKRSHIKSTRIAITLRELSNEFKIPCEKGLLGKQIERLALSLKGISTGSLEKILENSKTQHKRFSNVTNLELNDQILKVLENHIDLNSYDVAKKSLTKLNLISNDKCVKIKKCENIFEKLFYQKIKKILKDENLEIETANMNYLNELDNFNICIQKRIDLTKSLHLVHDQELCFTIGVKIATWREYSSRKLNFDGIFNSDFNVENYFSESFSIDPLRFKYDYKNYFDALMVMLNESTKIDMAIKSKSIALCFDTKILIEKLDEKNPSKTLTNEGFILSDFNLKNIRIQSDKEILLLTAFQNIRFSFFLNDLAICQADFILAKCFTENGDSWKKLNDSIFKGYETKFKIDNLEIRLLNRLIGFNLILLFLKPEVENTTFDLNRFTEVFEYFYLDENLTF